MQNHENDWFSNMEQENPGTPLLCGIENPQNGEICVLNLDHPGKWHMDGNDVEWFGQPSGIAWD